MRQVGEYLWTIVVHCLRGLQRALGRKGRVVQGSSVPPPTQPPPHYSHVLDGYSQRLGVYEFTNESSPAGSVGNVGGIVVNRWLRTLQQQGWSGHVRCRWRGQQRPAGQACERWTMVTVNEALFCGQLALSGMHTFFMFYYVKVFLHIFNVDELWFGVAQAFFLLWNAVNDPLFGYAQAGFIPFQQEGCYPKQES